MLDNFKNIVIKIGSTSIIDPKTRSLKSKWIDDLCKDIAKIHKKKKVIIVCSGAIALGSKTISNHLLPLPSSLTSINVWEE